MSLSDRSLEERIDSLFRPRGINPPVASHPHQHLMLSDFLIFTSPTAMKYLGSDLSVVNKEIVVDSESSPGGKEVADDLDFEQCPGSGERGVRSA